MVDLVTKRMQAILVLVEVATKEIIVKITCVTLHLVQTVELVTSKMVLHIAHAQMVLSEINVNWQVHALLNHV